MRIWRIAGTVSVALSMGLGCATSQSGSVPEEAGSQFMGAARETLDDLTAEFEELAARNARLDSDRAEVWEEQREDIAELRRQLAIDVELLESAPTEDREELHARIAENLGMMTHHVERAKLLATDGGEDLVVAARQRLSEVDRDIQSIEADAGRLAEEDREDASEVVEQLREQANEVEEDVLTLEDASPQAIEEQRDEVAESIAALSGTVQRESLELQAQLPN